MIVGGKKLASLCYAKTIRCDKIEDRKVTKRPSYNQHQKTIAQLRIVAGKVRARRDASDRIDAELLSASANRFKNMFHDQRLLLSKLRALDPDCALVAEFDDRDGLQAKELTMRERMELMKKVGDEGND